jgi:hypothetical protein
MRGLAAALVHRRICGIRLMELIAGLVLMVLAAAVYQTKASASHEAAAIADTNRKIALEVRRQGMLRARLANLERPARLEALSSAFLGLAPVSAKREAAPTDLMELSRRTEAPRP